MQIELLEQPESDVIAREDATDGEFYVRDDNSIWYRNELSPGNVCFVNSNPSGFLSAVEALCRYNRNVNSSGIEAEQMVFVQQFAAELSAAGALSGPTESFWFLIVEQAKDGMI